MVELEFRAVSRRFDDGNHAVRDVSLVVPPGQLTALLGPSGCGKTSLLRLAAGLDRPSSGRVLLDGRDITDVPPGERNVGLLFQSYALFPHLDVLGNVAFGLRMSGMSATSARERALAALRLVGLEEIQYRVTTELSGEQQQRVALARALAPEPSLLLLDEPLSNLDDRLRRQVREDIRALQQRLGITMAYVTHDETEAMAISDFMVVMHQGGVLQSGMPREVYERPVSEFVAGFMGDASVFDAKVDADGVARLGRLEVPVRVPAGARRLRVMVRPHAWCLLPAGRDGLAGRVLQAAYLGRRAEYRVDTELGTLLVVSQQSEALHQPGAPVSLALAARGVTAWAAPPTASAIGVLADLNDPVEQGERR